MSGEIDNGKLEELLKSEITSQMQTELFEILKDSRLLMPVTFTEIEGSDDMGFSINYLTSSGGENVIALYTGEDAITEAGIESDVYAIHMAELGDLLEQTDKYEVISINPFTPYDINIPVRAFLNIFDVPDEPEGRLDEMLEVLRIYSKRLEENTTLFLRSDENIMVENAVDGVFTPDVPFCVSSNPKYGEGLKYTNILLMPESKFVLHIGKDNDLDVVIAPGCEFHLEDVMDGTTNLWMCGKQPFFDE